MKWQMVSCLAMSIRPTVPSRKKISTWNTVKPDGQSFTDPQPQRKTGDGTGVVQTDEQLSYKPGLLGSESHSGKPLPSASAENMGIKILRRVVARVASQHIAKCFVHLKGQTHAKHRVIITNYRLALRVITGSPYSHPTLLESLKGTCNGTSLGAEARLKDKALVRAPPPRPSLGSAPRLISYRSLFRGLREVSAIVITTKRLSLWDQGQLLFIYLKEQKKEEHLQVETDGIISYPKCPVSSPPPENFRAQSNMHPWANTSRLRRPNGRSAGTRALTGTLLGAVGLTPAAVSVQGC